MTPDESTTPAARAREAAERVCRELGLELITDISVLPESGHQSSILLPCEGSSGQPFLLKYFVPPTDGVFYPAGVRLDDYSRREGAFYRFLDTVDPQRKQLPAPRTVLIDSGDPPRWILLERIARAVGPAEEILGQDHVFELLDEIQNIPVDSLLGRRNFPLNRWDTVSYLERVRLMYDPVLFVIGEQRWTRSQSFFQEALRWTETQTSMLVHGDFTESNIVVDQNGRAYLLDFERVGIGSPAHDFAWFWIHSGRSHVWKQQLLSRWFGGNVGSDRIRCEWGIRAALVYLALRRLRFGYLKYGADDRNAATNLALLDAALDGGSALFPG